MGGPSNLCSIVLHVPGTTRGYKGAAGTENCQSWVENERNDSHARGFKGALRSQ